MLAGRLTFVDPAAMSSTARYGVLSQTQLWLAVPSLRRGVAGLALYGQHSSDVGKPGNTPLDPRKSAFKVTKLVKIP